MVSHAGIVKRIVTFVVIVAGLSAIVYAPIIAAGSTHIAGGVITLLAMWIPAIAAFLACRIHHEPVRSLGWHLRKPRYLALAYLLPVAYTAIIGGIVWLIGAGAFRGNWPAHCDTRTPVENEVIAMQRRPCTFLVARTVTIRVATMTSSHRSVWTIGGYRTPNAACGWSSKGECNGRATDSQSGA